MDAGYLRAGWRYNASLSIFRSQSGPSLHSQRYLVRSTAALQSLVFLAPMLLLYEIGMFIHTPGPENGSVSIKARSVLINFLSEFGWAGRYLAPAMVVVVLVALHFARRENFRLDWRLYLAMGAEAVAEAIPLLMFALVWGRQVADQLSGRMLVAGVDTAGAAESWFVGIVTALGAGVYEELIFRLFAIALLHFVLVDLIGLNRFLGGALSILCAAVLFSAYHFTAANPFEGVKFLFFALAGCYLGVIYLLRGFGIGAAVHAFYNIFCVIIAHEAGR